MSKYEDEWTRFVDENWNYITDLCIELDFRLDQAVEYALKNGIPEQFKE